MVKNRNIDFIFVIWPQTGNIRERIYRFIIQLPFQRIYRSEQAVRPRCRNNQILLQGFERIRIFRNRVFAAVACGITLRRKSRIALSCFAVSVLELIATTRFDFLLT